MLLSYQAEPSKKPSNWRKKHEDFIATIRAAKALTQVMKDGGPLPPPPPPSYDPGSKQSYWEFNQETDSEEKEMWVEEERTSDETVNVMS